jgi:DNA invertase Pin-like site-specific DNA recombinase
MNPPPTIRRAIGYTRVSTDDQGLNGAGLKAQEAAIREEAKRRGWEVESVISDTHSGKTMNRLGVQAALAKLKAGTAEALICSKLDRLTRSVRDFAELLERSQAEGWALVLLDANIDTSTAEGEMVATNIANFAQFERRRIGERTKAGLRQRRTEGKRLGRPPSLPATTVTQIKNLRGPEDKPRRSYGAIAKYLNERGVPTAQGGEKWHASTVRAVLQRTQR